MASAGGILHFVFYIGEVAVAFVAVAAGVAVATGAVHTSNCQFAYFWHT